VPQARREDGLTSTPRQYPLWGKRGGWGRVTMTSRGVEISIAGGVVAMVRALSLGRFFSFFFCNHALFVSRYQKPYAALAMKRKKPISAIPPPAPPLHGKNQTPRVHRKSPPRLAPKIIYPRHVRKQYIETYR